ncbi:hypothetical protein Raf01_93250 [Rugosimonospora africana]|uniref:Uncharacterized protein n=1 Tax=Rugosimonospora africana TaxID=556532 RepID=A0A8J3R2A5_9ACTN|nr:hypothetical protein Raf01_93250 [Rugosimonospora africana]
MIRTGRIGGISQFVEIRFAMLKLTGSAPVVELGGGARLGGFELGPPLHLAAMLGEDLDSVSSVEILSGADIPIPDGPGYVCGGDGALRLRRLLRSAGQVETWCGSRR